MNFVPAKSFFALAFMLGVTVDDYEGSIAFSHCLGWVFVAFSYVNGNFHVASSVTFIPQTTILSSFHKAVGTTKSSASVALPYPRWGQTYPVSYAGHFFLDLNRVSEDRRLDH